MKKILLIFLSILILGVEPIIANDNQNDYLSLEDAITQANESNIQVKEAQLKQEQAKIRDRQAEKVRDMDDKMLGLLEQKRSKYVSAKQAELGVDLANLSVEYTKLDVDYQVKNSFYKVILKQEELGKVKLLLEQADKQKEVANKRFDLGLISKLELNQVENQVRKINLQLHQVESELLQSKQELNAELGQSLDAVVNIQPFLEDPKQINQLDTTILYDQALKHRPDIIQVQTKMELDKINYELTAKYYPPNVYEHQLVKTEYDLSQLGWENIKQQTLLNIQKAVDGYKLTLEAYEIAKEDLSLAEQKAKVTDQKFQQGMASDLDVLIEQTNLAESKLNLLNSKYRVWSALFQLEKLTGTDLVNAESK